MKGCTKDRRTILAAVTLLLGLIVPATSALAQGGGNPNPGVLRPSSLPYGRTYGEWSASWWQWAFSLPVSRSPLFDTTGARANNGQSGPVFFLAGVFGASGRAERTFTVPAGKAIFFPLLNTFANNACESSPKSVAELQAAVAEVVATTTELHASIDKVSLTDLTSYRAISPAFSATLPATDNLFQFLGCNESGIFFPNVADGFYIMLAPLPTGRHEIRFGGTFGAPVNFSLDVIDHVTVGP